MKIRLGYACVPVTINETSSHALTYTHYKRLGDKGNDKLDSVIKTNFESLEKILKYSFVLRSKEILHSFVILELASYNLSTCCLW